MLRLKGALIAVFIILGWIQTRDAAAEQTYVVKAGDSLSQIAYKFYRDQGQWRLIARANSNRVNPDGWIITVGMNLLIPDVDGQLTGPAGIGPVYSDTANGVTRIDVVTGNEYKPFTDDSLPEGGMVTEIVRKAFQHIGYEPVIDFLNWPSGYDLTKRGKFAATFPYIPNEERKADFLYSDPVAENLTYVYWRMDRGLDLKELDDLAGLRVCRPQGHFSHFLNDLVTSNQIDFYQPKNTNECFADLMDEKTDVAVIGDLDGRAELIDMGIVEQVERSDFAAYIGSLHVIWPKSSLDSPARLAEFNSAISGMNETGEMQEIVQRHLKAFYASLESAKN